MPPQVATNLASFDISHVVPQLNIWDPVFQSEVPQLNIWVDSNTQCEANASVRNADVTFFGIQKPRKT